MAEVHEVNHTAGVTIGVVKETAAGETRVGLIPESVKHLTGKGLAVVVQAGAGEGSSISDDEYVAQGASILPTAAEVYDAADVVIRVQAPADEDLAAMKPEQILVSFLAPLFNHELNTKLAQAGVTAMAVDAVPRITRAQSMDALSAMASIGGYKAVLLAASHLPKFFPLLMTAAGTIRPARVLVLGAGVAGLQAIATARRLGAVVEAYDTRAVVKEQVESLGAKFVEIDTGADAAGAGGYAREATPEELRKQQEGLNEHIAKADVVITTAAVPGRPAPKLIPASAVERMHHGSVIVDLAAETGGNCELTTKGEITTEHGVTIIGLLNLPATLPVHASQLYAKVITNFLDLLIRDGQIDLNMDDEIISAMTITRGGEIVQEQTRKMMGLDEAHSPVHAAAPEVARSEAEAMDAESYKSDIENFEESYDDEVPSESEIVLDQADAVDASLVSESLIVEQQPAVFERLEDVIDEDDPEFAPSDEDVLYDEENVDFEAQMTEPTDLPDYVDIDAPELDVTDFQPDDGDDVVPGLVVEQDENDIDAATIEQYEVDESALTDTTADEATVYVEEEKKDE